MSKQSVGRVILSANTFDTTSATTWTFQLLPNPKVNKETFLIVVGRGQRGQRCDDMFFDRGSLFDSDS